MRAAVRWTLFGSLVALAAPAAMPGQVPTPPPPHSPSLLRRLAAVADAYRTGDSTFFVMSDSFPHAVGGAYPTRLLANARAVALGPRYHVYSTKAEGTPPGPNMMLVGGCFKDTRTTEWVCPMDSLRLAAPVELVESVELVFQLKRGGPIRHRLDPQRVGLIVLTPDAFDHFIVPYYTEIANVETAAAMQQRMRDYLRRSMSTGP